MVDWFSASWCSKCKQLKPIVEGMCEELGLELVEHDIDTPEGQAKADAAGGVLGIPRMTVGGVTYDPSYMKKHQIRKLLEGVSWTALSSRLDRESCSSEEE